MNISKWTEMRTEGRDGIEFWKFRQQLGQPSEIFVAKEEEPRLHKFFRDNQILHRVLIDDFGM